MKGKEKVKMVTLTGQTEREFKNICEKIDMGIDPPIRCYFCKRSADDKSVQFVTSEKNGSDLRLFPNLMGKINCKIRGLSNTKVVICWECAIIISAIGKGQAGGWEPIK